MTVSDCLTPSFGRGSEAPIRSWPTWQWHLDFLGGQEDRATLIFLLLTLFYLVLAFIVSPPLLRAFLSDSSIQ